MILYCRTHRGIMNISDELEIIARTTLASFIGKPKVIRYWDDDHRRVSIVDSRNIPDVFRPQIDITQ